jgi:hypothetical protein
VASAHGSLLPLILLCVYLLYASFQIAAQQALRTVTYKVIVVQDNAEKHETQVWEDHSSVVVHFNSNNVVLGIVSYQEEEGVYKEQFDFANSISILKLSKPPQKLEKNEVVTGEMTLASKSGDLIYPMKVTVTKMIRPVDGRIISKAVATTKDGHTLVTVRLYDDKISSYSLPDEVLEETIWRHRSTTTLHIVAAGRQFLPIDYREILGLDEENSI